MAGALLAAGYTALILYALQRWRWLQAPGLSIRALSLLFLLKVMAGMVLWAIYTYVHTDRATADIHKYFDDGLVMYGALPGHPQDYIRMLLAWGNDTPYFDAHYYRVMNNWYRAFETGYYNDSHTLIRYNALLSVLSFGNYHVHTVISAFLATLGGAGFYHAFVHRCAGREGFLLIAVFLLPSVMFWTSGVLKENLLWIGLGAFLWGLMAPVTGKHNWRHLAMVAMGVCILLLVKSYVVLSLTPGLVAWWWSRDRSSGILLRFALVHLLMLAIVVVLGWMGHDVLELLVRQQRDFEGMARSVSAGSYVPIPALEPEWSSFIRHAPHALFMTFLSPLMTWDRGALGAMAALETVGLLVLVLYILFRIVGHKTRDLPLLLWSVSFLLILGAVIGWTTPVIGALVRYRIPLLPFLILGALAWKGATHEPRTTR